MWVQAMSLMIMYFNLKEGVSEEEFVKKAKEFINYHQAKVDGFGAARLYRHHAVGANPRTYQIHMEFKNFGTWDRFVALNEKDAKAAKLTQENGYNLIDMKTHYDELVREIPLQQ
jgi:hypothetical protein